MRNRNFLHWLSPSTLSEAQRELDRRARAVERLRRRSPLEQEGLASIRSEIWRSLGGARDPQKTVGVSTEEIEELVSALLCFEGLQESVVASVPLVSDVRALRDADQQLASRERWCANTRRMAETMANGIQSALDALRIRVASQHTDETTGAGPFLVSRAALVGDLPRALEDFLLAVYHGELVAGGVLNRIRDLIERNLLTVSGLPSNADIVREQRRIVFPTSHQETEASVLAERYLKGTPFAPLLAPHVPFRVEAKTRLEHAICFGGSGHGKTQLIQSLFLDDLNRGDRSPRGVVVIDSQGDLIRKIAKLQLFSPETSPENADRLIIIDAAEVEHPPALNLFGANLTRLSGYTPATRESILNGIIEAYEALFGDLLGAELTQKQGVIFKYLARLMVAIPGATIHTLMDVMSDGQAYRPFMQAMPGSARLFFETEFFHPSFAATRRQVLRRLWGVMSTPAFERMFAQRENRLDLFAALQSGRVVLINTAKDILKAEGSSLFGRFLLKLLAQAALERAAVPETERLPAMVYVDEAHEYVDDAVETLFGQGRKYGIGLFLATQTPEHFDHRLRSVIFANTSVKIAGGVSAHDAKLLADELHTTAAMISGTRRMGDASEFALWVRNRTPQALKVRVPLGRLEAEPVMSAVTYEALMAANHDRVSGSSLPAFGVKNTPEPSRAHAGETKRPAAEPTKPAPPPRPTPANIAVPPPSGKGGPEHRRVQDLIKRLAEERGLRAVLEEQVDAGQVDVGLHQGAFSIACEISITSTPKYEMQNITKCLRAGFGEVWVVTIQARRLSAIRTQALTALDHDQLERVRFLSLDDIPEALSGLAVPESKEPVVKGYKVKTTRRAVPATEAAARRAAIARALSDSLTRQRGKTDE